MITRDARFEEGALGPLRLRALDEGDVQVISALVQDAVLPIEEMTWRRGERRFALLLNRFRWEGATDSSLTGHPPERVRSMLVVEGVAKVQTQGLNVDDRGTVLSLLSLEWQAGEDAAGTLTFVLAGDGAIRVEVEALEVVLQDVTRPYLAPSRKTPSHE